jgi:hypothetical protein
MPGEPQARRRPAGQQPRRRHAASHHSARRYIGTLVRHRPRGAGENAWAEYVHAQLACSWHPAHVGMHTVPPPLGALSDPARSPPLVLVEQDTGARQRLAPAGLDSLAVLLWTCLCTEATAQCRASSHVIRSRAPPHRCAPTPLRLCDVYCAPG